MKLVVVFVQYDQEKYPQSLSYLQKYLKRISYDKQIIIVDNKKPIDYLYISEGMTTIGYNNKLWEFGAYQQAVYYCNYTNIEYDAMLFVNDSFLSPNGITNIYNTISDESFEKCTNNTAIVGDVIDANYNDVQINGYKVDVYIRTHCFMMSREAIEKVKTLWSVDEKFLNKCISKTVSYPYFKPNAPMNGIAKRSLVRNLTELWHSKEIFETMTESNWELFRMKVMACINEVLLTPRIKEAIK